MSGLNQPRSTPRFLPDTPFAAMFTVNGQNLPVGIRDLSVTGAQIEHSQPLRPAAQGTLVIGDLQVPAAVIWTRLVASGAYWSGVRIDAGLDVIAATIRDLLNRGIVKKPGVDTIRRREAALRAREEARLRLVSATQPAQTGPTDEQITLIRHAREHLQTHPEEALRWYNRARATATEDQIRIASGGRPNREDVLAVWEYLERSIDLRYVVQVL
jgi:hypothetical protein